MQSFAALQQAHLQQQAERTIRELVTTFGFEPNRSKEAVDAIGDKSDVQMAYNWLLDHGEEDRGGAINLRHCPHTDSLKEGSLVPVSSLTYGQPCCEGCVSGENWLCLHCGDTRCSRYVNRHNFVHWQATRTQEEALITIADAQAGRQAIGHHLAISLSDLSVWCYACEAYIDPSSGKSPVLAPYVRRMEALKFSEEASPVPPVPRTEAPPPPAAIVTTIAAERAAGAGQHPSLSPIEMHGSIGAAQGGDWPLPELTVECGATARPGYKSHAAHEYLDDPDVLRSKVVILAGLLLESNHAVAYTGAGISTASGIKDYATRAGAASVASANKANPTSLWEAQPTLAHRVLTALHTRGHLQQWLQQNHDGLPQKAGFPQKDLNEIHGSWYDPSNPVVPMDGSLRQDLIRRLLDTEDSADLCMALGTSMVGMNADRIAVSTATRARHGRASGLVIVSLQRTQYDGIAQLRIFATIDEVARLLAEALNIPAEEYSEPPPKTVARSNTTGFCAGTKVKILGQPEWDIERHGSVGTVEGFDEEGNMKIRMAHKGKLRVVGKWWFERGNLHGLPIAKIDD